MCKACPHIRPILHARCTIRVCLGCIILPPYCVDKGRNKNERTHLLCILFASDTDGGLYGQPSAKT